MRREDVVRAQELEARLDILEESLRRAPDPDNRLGVYLNSFGPMVLSPAADASVRSIVVSNLRRQLAEAERELASL